MNCLQIRVVCILLLANINKLHGTQFERQYINPASTAAGSSNQGECPSESVREELRSTICQEIRSQLQNLTRNTTGSTGMLS
jgi:hypothetical protein